MKYIRFNFKYSLAPAGIGHQLSNLLTLILYSYKNNLIPIIPTFKLEALHNLGKFLNTNFDEYLDYSNLTIDGQKFPVILDESNIDKTLIRNLDIHMTRETRNGSLFKDPKLIDKKCILEITPFYLPQALSNWNNNNIENIENSENKTIKIFIPFNKNIISLYNKLELNLKDYTCVHIRSGDFLTTDKKFGGKHDYISKISALNIKNKIESITTNKNVYIMTNIVYDVKKKNGIRFNDNIEKIYNDFNYNQELIKLKDEFNCKLYNDYPFLYELSIKNNYLLYFVEILIMYNAKKRISMFNSENDYYDTYIIDKLYENQVTYV
jgi:hypothetical protein